MRRYVALAFLFVFSITACAAQDASEMGPLASALTKLSRAVDAAANAPNLSALSGDALLEAATRHDKTLLTPFQDYKIQILRRGGNSIVLVCDSSADRALLEDAGCTPPLERQHWREQRPCTFSLSIESVCN